MQFTNDGCSLLHGLCGHYLYCSCHLLPVAIICVLQFVLLGVLPRAILHAPWCFLGGLPRAIFCAPVRAFSCAPSCRFVCSSSCFLVYTPSCHFVCVCSSSCFLVYSFVPFCMLQFVLFGSGIPLSLQKPVSCDPYKGFCKAPFCKDHFAVYPGFVVERLPL